MSWVALFPTTVLDWLFIYAHWEKNDLRKSWSLQLFIIRICHVSYSSFILYVNTFVFTIFFSIFLYFLSILKLLLKQHTVLLPGYIELHSCPNGYPLLRADYPKSTKRGGVCIYFKESLPLIKRNDLTDNKRLPCKLGQLNNKKCFFTCPYRSPFKILMS